MSTGPSHVEGHRFSRATAPLINNLRQVSISTDYSSRELLPLVSLQNGNSFPVAAVELGFTSKATCPLSKAEYDVSTICGAKHEPIGANTYGTQHCGPLPPTYQRMTMCVIGLEPYITKNGEFVAWLDSNGYCPMR